MERNTPVRKTHTNTTDLLAWPENTPAPSSTPTTASRPHQPSDGIRKVVFGGQVTDEEFESLNKRKPCSGYKMKEMTGSGIFIGKGENEESDPSNANPTPNSKTGIRMYQQAVAGISHISFADDESVSPRKPSSLTEVAKQRELSGTLESDSDGKLKKQLSNAKSKELSGHDIFAPPPEILPRPTTTRAPALKESIEFGESSPRNPGGGQISSEDAAGVKTAKKIYDKKFCELSGNDIFKGEGPPSAEKSLSTAKLREMSGSNIFADGKVESRDYLGGVRKPPGDNMKRDGDAADGARRVSNVPSFSLFHHHHHQNKPLFTVSTPSNRPSFHSPSECSSSSSSLSNGFCSFEDASLYQTPAYYYLNGLRSFDTKSPLDAYNVNGKLVDELGLSQSLYKMSIRGEQTDGCIGRKKGVEMDPHGFGSDSDTGSVFAHGNGYSDASPYRGSVQCNYNNYSSYGVSNNGVSHIEGCQSSPYGVCLSSDDHTNCSGFQGGFEKRSCGSMGSFVGLNQSGDACFKSSQYCNQGDYLLEQRREQGRSSTNRGFPVQNSSSSRPNFNDALLYQQQYEMDPNGGRGVMDPLDSPHLNVHSPLYKSLLLKERSRALTRNGVPHTLLSMKGAGDMESLSGQDGLIMNGTGLNHLSNKGNNTLSGHKKSSLNEIAVQMLRGKSISLDSYCIDGGVSGDAQGLMNFSPFPVVDSLNSLHDLQGYIYLMAQDQNGCRFLQKIFDEGTSRDIEIIFNEIIDHVVELMVKPFGNYVIQKFLDVCNEDQRLQIVHMVTKEPGQLVRICLNTYGTRVVQKLIETLNTNHQISLVVMAMKPGSLDLMRDQNGNHVIQRCLQCLSNQYNKFIFDAAARFCVEIATHRHGCCVLQRCIGHAQGKQRDKLILEVTKNGLLLAQDPFGNYVVQYIIEQKCPSAIANLLSQFKGHYIHLAMQKFSSHVVEKCLKYFEESRPRIVREFLSVSNFEQLMQDPFANYVIQSALAVTEGPLHNLLVEAVRPHMVLRTSPYCKRIFSRNLLKK